MWGGDGTLAVAFEPHMCRGEGGAYPHDWSAATGTRATLKALPSAPHPARPYREWMPSSLVNIFYLSPRLVAEISYSLSHPIAEQL
jgi:hypothetical protein